MKSLKKCSDCLKLLGLQDKMDKIKINDLEKPYYIEVAKDKNVFKIPKSVATEENENRGYNWIFDDYDSQELILGEKIIECPLNDLSIVIKQIGRCEEGAIDVIKQLRNFAKVLGYDYVSSKNVERHTAKALCDNLYRVYPRLFKLAQSETSSKSLVEKIWEVDIPKIKGKG
jgi:hypothetical protein